MNPVKRRGNKDEPGTAARQRRRTRRSGTAVKKRVNRGEAGIRERRAHEKGNNPGQNKDEKNKDGQNEDGPDRVRGKKKEERRREKEKRKAKRTYIEKGQGRWNRR